MAPTAFTPDRTKGSSRVNETPAGIKHARGRIRGVTPSTVAQATTGRNYPGRRRKDPGAPARRNLPPLRDEILCVCRPMLSAAGPSPTSRTAPSKSVRCSESRCGSSEATSAKERIAQNRRDLFFAAAARVANQMAHIHAEGRRPAVPAIPAWESPCRSRFWRCRCAAPASAPPIGAGSNGARGATRAPARQPAGRPARHPAPAGWSPVAAPEAAGSSISRGLWHFLQRELLVLYCISLQYSHRTTSRVSTLTKVVAIGMRGVPELGPRGCMVAPHLVLLSRM